MDQKPKSAGIIEVARFCTELRGVSGWGGEGEQDAICGYQIHLFLTDTVN